MVSSPSARGCDQRDSGGPGHRLAGDDVRAHHGGWLDDEQASIEALGLNFRHRQAGRVGPRFADPGAKSRGPDCRWSFPTIIHWRRSRMVGPIAMDLHRKQEHAIAGWAQWVRHKRQGSPPAWRGNRWSRRNKNDCVGSLGTTCVVSRPMRAKAAATSIATSLRWLALPSTITRVADTTATPRAEPT
jgi:hypothetical protein